jgi:Ty3 transposon capsid-like protein
MSETPTARITDEQLQSLYAALKAHEDQIKRLEEAQQVNLFQQTSQQSTSGVNFKPVKPNIFSGGARSNVDTWLWEMERYFLAAGMKDPNTVMFAEAFLRDTAADWWRMQTTQCSQVVTDWNSFKVCFQNRFGTVNAAKTARSTLFAWKQMSTVQAYTDGFQRHAQMLPGMDEDTKVHLYLRGLKGYIAKEVDSHEPKDLAQAMKLAQNTELRIRNFHNVSSNRLSAMNSKSANTIIPMELGNTEVTSEIDYMEIEPEEQELAALSTRNSGFRRMTDSEYERHRKEGLCYRCHRKGHLGRHCPSNQRTNQTSKQKNE